MEKKRCVGYDIIRIMSMLMVVAIHSNVLFLLHEYGSKKWYIVMNFTACYLVAVPLYFMISGALLLNGNTSNYKYRFFKQAIPFLAWSIIYTVVRGIIKGSGVHISDFFCLLNEPAHYQFWFMYTLLAIYILLPILQKLLLILNKKQIEYILVLWIIFSIIQPTLAHCFPILSISEHVDLVLCEGYIGYFVLGYYLKNYCRQCTVKKALCIAVFGLFLIISSSTVEFLIQENDYVGYFYQNYFTPGVPLAASGIFLLAQNMNFAFAMMKAKFITFVSNMTIGVFYLHMLVLSCIELMGVRGDHSIIELSIKIVLIYIFSLIGSAIIYYIPFLNKILLGIENKKNLS